MTDWAYFGCDRVSGHYLFDRSRNRINASDPLYHRLRQFDGSLPPMGKGLYVASVTRLGGIGMAALAWWDKSVDTRPGSNSIVFCPVLNGHSERMLEMAVKTFPWVFSRLPQPLKLMGEA